VTTPADVVRSTTASGVAVLTLNRPDRANAFTPRMAAELTGCLVEAEADGSVCAVVLTGSGRQFCAGMDAAIVADIAESTEHGGSAIGALQPTLLAVQRATTTIAASGKPIVAALNGAAAAGGLDVALACDYRVAADTATFVESYARLGLPPLNGSAFLLRGQVSRSAAFRLLSAAERLDARAALDLGLIDVICPPRDVLDTAVDLAKRMSVGGGALVRHIKAELRRGTGEQLSDALLRAFMAGIEFADSERFRQASRRLVTDAARREPVAAGSASPTGTEPA
jgi:2-(1,2-epoxy-1,2-dihydrophenyl)acetyl-CoA isomerase